MPQKFLPSQLSHFTKQRRTVLLPMGFTPPPPKMSIIKRPVPPTMQSSTRLLVPHSSTGWLLTFVLASYTLTRRNTLLLPLTMATCSVPLRATMPSMTNQFPCAAPFSPRLIGLRTPCPSIVAAPSFSALIVIGLSGRPLTVGAMDW